MTYKVSLTSGTYKVVFEVSAPISESRTANYDGHSIVHLPTDVLSYRNTTGRSFGITARLVSRTVDEATANSRIIDLIRSWVLPSFGSSGATPPIIKLSGYNNRNLNDVPCVIRSYSITYPDDVDWVFDGNDPMPVICILSVNLEEAYSAFEITKQKWKIKVTPEGKGYEYGSVYNDPSSMAGGQQVITITNFNSPGYSGIATTLPIDATKSITGAPLVNNQMTPSSGNGDLSSVSGIGSSPQIASKTISDGGFGNSVTTTNAIMTSTSFKIGSGPVYNPNDPPPTVTKW